MKDKRKTIRAAVLIGVLAFAIEGLFFNFHSFRLLGGGFSSYDVSLDQVETAGFSYDESTGCLTYVPDAEDYYIELKDFNQPVGTVYLDFQAAGENTVCKAGIMYTDESNQEYVTTDLRRISENVEDSKYFTCRFHGSTQDLRVYFDKTEITVSSFQINKTVPWHFQPLRFFIVYTVLFLLYLITKNRWFLCPVEEQTVRHRALTVACTMLFSCFLLFTAYTSVEEKSLGLDEGDLYSQDLTDAFLAGQVSLLTEPDPLLETLSNPYDIEARQEVGLYADWQYRMDVSYYNGQFYCYFGPVPSLLLFVPFTMMTGQYLQTAWACLFFAVIAAVFMAAAVEAFIRKFFGRLPYGYLFLGNLILWFSSGLLWNLRRPMFYELAIVSSAAFVTFGFYMMITAFDRNKPGRSQISFARLTLGCIALALAVGCRPLSLLYSLAIVPVLWVQYRKYRHDRPVVVKAVLSVALPYLIIGGMLAYYNLVRFGSITEFGVTWQLSTIDMTGESWKPYILPICIWLTMFVPPVINCTFPFVYGDLYGEWNFIGKFAHQNREIGLFFQNPLMIVVLSPAAWRRAGKTYGKGPARAVLSALICALLIFVFSSFTGGSAVRYITDYGVVMSAVALLLYFGLYPAAEEKDLTKLLSKILLAATVIAVGIGFFRSLYGEGDLFWRYHPDLYLKLQYIFCFWM